MMVKLRNLPFSFNTTLYVKYLTLNEKDEIGKVISFAGRSAFGHLIGVTPILAS